MLHVAVPAVQRGSALDARTTPGHVPLDVEQENRLSEHEYVVVPMQATGAST